MTYIVKISYFDQEPEREEYGTLDEACECFNDVIDQKDQLGMAFGDVSRVAVIRFRAGKYATLQARDYD